MVSELEVLKICAKGFNLKQKNRVLELKIGLRRHDYAEVFVTLKSKRFKRLQALLNEFLRDLKLIGFQVLVKDFALSKNMLLSRLEVRTSRKLEVFKKLLEVPKGFVVSYKQLAIVTGLHPRTIGVLMRNNPFPVLIPCHRVVHENKSIGGYSSGVSKKLMLLRKEGVVIKNNKVLSQTWLFKN